MLGGVDLLVAEGATAEHLTAIVPAAADAAAKGLEPGKLPLVILTPAGQASEPTTIDLLERSCVILSARGRRSRSWPGRPDR